MPWKLVRASSLALVFGGGDVSETSNRLEGLQGWLQAPTGPAKKYTFCSESLFRAIVYYGRRQLGPCIHEFTAALYERPAF